ncbi:dolichyl-P-Man:Man(5)GlcNAc(2)-PP-dolichol alpha-1,3-mannosyltransferase [Phlyctochytrium bullatum]|nr:dolichyl-P-Man:Man(5)GlcNAc(2)-PP-dolichol alpha-1,3-mannosyltransferase [Phlyctochytrium bullatum]
MLTSQDTEIDWTAYMQQVAGFLAGERDYKNLKGDTGPLVYPAGFLYVFTLLHQVTSKGRDVVVAQAVFAFLSAFTVGVVASLYQLSDKVEWLASMLLLYLCMWFMCKNRWTTASIFFSLALSVKMNVLLFAPGFAFLHYEATGLASSVANALLVVLTQVLIGLPFLLHNASSYLSRSFEFSRVFLYRWTVNWRFVPEEVFLGKTFSTALLISHLTLLVSFAATRWCK